MFKKYLISYLYLFSIIIGLTIIATLINYFGEKDISIIKILIPIIAIFFSSLILGKNSKKKGYIEGIKFSLGFLFISSILKIIFKVNFNLKTIIISFILLSSSVLGAMMGINANNKTKSN